MKPLLLRARKRGKPFLCILLTMLLLISTTWGAASLTLHASGAELTFDIGVNPESVTAVLTDDGLLTISGVGETQDYTADTAPFQDYKITSVKFGTGVTSVGDYLFYNCGGLTGSLTLPKGLVRIGTRAFSGESEALSPKPAFVENQFTQALVTGKKETASPKESPTPEPSQPGAETVSSENQENQESPVSAVSQAAPAESSLPAEEPVSSSLSEASIASAEASSLPEDASQTETSSAPESAAASSESPVPPPPEEPAEVSSNPEPSEESGDQYTVETITEQQIGTEIFYPMKRQSPFFCSKENESFRSAMWEAGFQEAQSLVSAVFDCGDGVSSAENTVVRTLPLLDGSLILPGLPQEFSAPEEGGSLFAWSFRGWTEQRDSSGVVRPAGSAFRTEARDDLYFIASWTREVQAKIHVERSGNVTVFSVPETEGYTFTSFQWQSCEFAPDRDFPTDQESLPWQNIPDAVEAVYSRKLQPGDGNRLFRCLITAKKQENLFRALFSNADQGEEVALPAVRSGITQYQKTLAVSKGTGQAVVSQSISLPTSVMETGNTVYKLTGVSITEEFSLVLPTESGSNLMLPELGEGQTAGNTFALRLDPTGAGWNGLEGSADQWGAYVLSQLPDSSAAWNSGVNHVWKRGDSYPTPLGNGTEAEASITLAYRSDYETFSGGQVVLTLEEYAGDTVKNTVSVTLTLEDTDSYSQTASLSSGRSFSFPEGAPSAAVAGSGAVTAGFLTKYYPSAHSSDAFLRLYKTAEGSSPVLTPFPTGTGLVLGDLSTPSQRKFYSLQAAENDGSLTLSGFSSAETGGGNYAGPGEVSGPVQEKLLFAVDFSTAQSALPSGSYFLALSHGADRPMEDLAQAAFSISSTQQADYSLTMTAAPSSGLVWTLQLAAQTPSADTRYTDGKRILLSLADSAGHPAAFPTGISVSGNAESPSLGQDGTLSFSLPASGSGTVSLDFSHSAGLASGEYKLSAELRPQPGLQTGSDAEEADASAGPVPVTLSREGDTSQRSLSVSLPEGSLRLLDVSTAPAALSLSLNYQGTETGDTLELSILEKTGDTPDAESYTAASGCTVSPAHSQLSTSGGTVAITVTAPQNQRSGTYRMLARILDSSGNPVAEQPYNFIVQ